MADYVDRQTQTLGKWLQEAHHTVVVTGAGMSTESGLPDFRSTDTGLWQNLDPSQLASLNALAHHREDFISFYQWRMQGMKDITPHDGHHILADWEEKGLIHSIITQNVDGFHQTAGNEQVAELHGTLRHFQCHHCGTIYPANVYENEQFYCSCGGFIRPSVVLFGEMLPEDDLMLAQSEIEQADLCIVLGSSLRVMPANQFPMQAKQNGAKLVIVNEEPTPMDDWADLTISERKIGEVLRDVQSENEGENV